MVSVIKFHGPRVDTMLIASLFFATLIASCCKQLAIYLDVEM